MHNSRGDALNFCQRQEGASAPREAVGSPVLPPEFDSAASFYFTNDTNDGELQKQHINFFDQNQ